ncbi:nuclear transport factor 2 family protein [bacterium]|nr:nuclear transport factor 2 family protein [bacterium]
MTAADPIHLTLERFHANLRGELEGGYDALLHPDVVFYSPVVFTPQEGREITKLYLSAAGSTLPGDAPASGESSTGDAPATSFTYTKTIASGHQAMLEFETMMDGKYVNGVDILTCDDDSLVTEFKVMMRPLQAVNIVHEQMKAMLEKMTAGS